MTDDDNLKLDLILNQQGTLLMAVHVFREDMNVMMEILRRVENSVNSIGLQLTEMHAFNRRTAERVRVLEERGP